MTHAKNKNWYVCNRAVQIKENKYGISQEVNDIGDILTCLHFDTNLFLSFSNFFSACSVMYNFSSRHNLQCFSQHPILSWNLILLFYIHNMFTHSGICGIIHRKWTGWPKFKFWMELYTFQIVFNMLRKNMNPTILYLWVNSRADLLAW